MSYSVEMYVDGSFSREEPDVVKAAVIFVDKNTQEPILAGRALCYKQDYVKSWNVGGELFAATYGLVLATQIFKEHVDEELNITIHYDYKGIQMFVQGPNKWNPKTAVAKEYANCMTAFKRQYPKMKVFYHKVKAHSGNKWNECVDKLTRGEVDSSIAKVLIGEFKSGKKDA